MHWHAACAVAESICGCVMLLHLPAQICSSIWPACWFAGASARADCCHYDTALADIGDIDNARALYERVLTEDTNRKSTKLWEHYLAFEFEMGDLQTALRLEKRAREALGEAPGAPAGGGASARNIQLLLLRYQFNESLPCPPGQRLYLEYLMGRGPPPPGFEKQQRPSRTGSAAAAAAADGEHGER